MLNNLKNFRSNFDRAQGATSPLIITAEEQVVDKKSSPGSVKKTLSTYSRTGNTIQFLKICFVCNEIRPCCEFECAAARLKRLSHQVDEGIEVFDIKQQ